MNDYQRGIMIALGSMLENRYCIRNVDRWYCDVVQPVFGTTVYSQREQSKEFPQWVIKSANVRPPRLSEITDYHDFCRAYIEIHGIIDIVLRRYSRVSPEKTKVPRLRIYGPEEILIFIMENLPAKEKKVQYIKNNIQGGYIGQTCAIYYQSKREVMNIIDYIKGDPRNESQWKIWRDRLSET